MTNAKFWIPVLQTIQKSIVIYYILHCLPNICWLWTNFYLKRYLTMDKYFPEPCFHHWRWNNNKKTWTSSLWINYCKDQKVKNTFGLRITFALFKPIVERTFWNKNNDTNISYLCNGATIITFSNHTIKPKDKMGEKVHSLNNFNLFRFYTYWKLQNLICWSFRR